MHLKKRALLFSVCFLIGLGVIVVRLTWLQIITAADMMSDVPKDWIVDRELPAKRGSIYDRTHTRILATQVDAYYLVVDPRRIRDPHKMAARLSPVLDIDQHKLYNMITQDKKSVEINDEGKRTYSPEIRRSILDMVRAGEIEGIYSYPTRERFYPENIATHVLGFLNKENAPVGGIEKYYDNALRGKQGEIKYLKSKDGIMIADKPEKHQPAINGQDIILTIDADIQKGVESELAKAVAAAKAKGGTAIVADPRTGEILALASNPTFNNNKYFKEYTPHKARNMAIESQFEPGSTFKIVTLAAAIEEKLFNPQETFTSGSIKVGDRVIHDWQREGWGVISYARGFELSSNVAFVNLGGRLGANRLTRYIERFGFGNITARTGQTTGIDLPGESSGYYFNAPLGEVELATSSFGQGLAVTPIQQLAAISAIANNGVWTQPHLVREVGSVESDKYEPNLSLKRVQIIKPETAQMVSSFLRDVVVRGTGKNADLPSFKVAGKTGTAQKPDPSGAGYLKNKYIVSFMGFAPVDRPSVVVYVALDEPATVDHSGSLAAPLAREIFKKALHINRAKQPREV